MTAARRGHLGIQKQLLSSGADVTVTDAEVNSNIYSCRVCDIASLGANRELFMLHTPAALHAVSAAVITSKHPACQFVTQNKRKTLCLVESRTEMPKQSTG